MLLANAGAMLMQLIVAARWSPQMPLRVGMTLGLSYTGTIAPSPVGTGSLDSHGVASGMASPGYSAGASLAVERRASSGIAGVINATGAITWIVAP